MTKEEQIEMLRRLMQVDDEFLSFVLRFLELPPDVQLDMIDTALSYKYID